LKKNEKHFEKEQQHQHNTSCCFIFLFSPLQG
jgi:hypothetical protein